MCATYGERFCETVADYLKTHGYDSLGKINRATLIVLADKFEAAERRKDKKEREKRLSKGERDKLYDALAEAAGCDLAAMTENEQTRCGIAISAIIRATPDVTPAEIKAAGRRYRREFAGASITPHAIANNWSKIFDKNARESGVSEIDWAKEPDFDWRRVCAIRYPRDQPKYRERRQWEEDGWSLVPPNVKQTIWAEGRKLLG